MRHGGEDRDSAELWPDVYRILVENARDGIYLVDAGTRFSIRLPASGRAC